MSDELPKGVNILGGGMFPVEIPDPAKIAQEIRAGSRAGPEGGEVKTYEKAWFITDQDPFDAAFGDLRCGELKPGDKAKIWCQEEGRYIRGTMGWFAGQPSVKEEESVQGNEEQGSGGHPRSRR